MCKNGTKEKIKYNCCAGRRKRHHTGSAARIGCDMEDAPVDAAIVGIVDAGTGLVGVINK